MFAILVPAYSACCWCWAQHAALGFRFRTHTPTPHQQLVHTHRQRNKNIIFSATKFVNFIVSQIYSKCSFLIELWGHKRVERRQRLFLWTMNIMLILESTVTTTIISATTTTTSNEVTWTTNREHHRRRVINCISSFCTGHISTWGFRTSIRARFAPWSQEHLPPSLYRILWLANTSAHLNASENVCFICVPLVIKINSVCYGAQAILDTIYNLICYSSKLIRFPFDVHSHAVGNQSN